MYLKMIFICVDLNQRDLPECRTITLNIDNWSPNAYHNMVMHIFYALFIFQCVFNDFQCVIKCTLSCTYSSGIMKKLD